MADKKISQLSAATTPLAGTEVLPIVQNSTTVKVPVSDLTTGRTVSVLNLNSTNDSTINGMRVGVGGGNNTTNTAVGYQALNATATGGYCVGIGYFANRKVTSGIYNTAVGFDCGSNITTGQSNTAVGGGAGNSLTTGNNNAFWGFNAQPSSATVSNEYTYGDANVTAHRFTGGNLVIGTSGKGIDFSAVTNPNATNEILTDYAEGTWTPTLAFGGASTGITYAAQVGTYTRIGNLVVARFTIVLSNKGSATGTATIDGLPFTVAGVAPGAATTIIASNFAANAPQIGYAGNGTTTVLPTAFNASGSVGSLDTDFANNTRLDMWVQYFA